MKKITNLSLTAMIVLSLTACGPTPESKIAETPAQAPTAVTITTLNGNKEPVEIEVPYNPQRLAVMDMAVLDMLDNWDLGDRVVGMAKTTYVDYLSAYIDNDDIKNLGTLHEADLEAMMEVNPDIIFIGGRMSSQYDALSEIAPVVYLGTDYEIGLMQSMKSNTGYIASIFGVGALAESQIAGFNDRIAMVADAAKGKTAVIGVCTNGGFNTLGNKSRCSVIGSEAGFENLADDVNATHGNESSFELLVELNPDYIFVLDRDTAISAEGAQIAQEVMENQLVQQTKAYKNSQIIYLTPTPWYLAEGGISAMNAMLTDLESAILQ